MQLLCILAAPHDKCRAWCRSSCSNGSFSCSHIYWGLLCSGNFGPLSSVHVRWMLCFCSSHFWHPVVTTPTVSLAMALMVSHLRKANGLVPFGAIWCLCCCTCGSLLAKVNWQNGSVYCSERLVKRPKKKSVIHCCCANIQRSPPMPVTASVQGQEHLEIACCKPIRLHAHGSHGLETISLHVFFVFISWYAIMYGYGSNLEYWSDGRLVIFRMIWNQSCEKGKVTVMTFWPISIYAYIYICYGQNIMGVWSSIPYIKWESKHNGCMNPC